MEYFANCMTHEALEQEHRRLVIKMHPDRNPDNPNATAEFQEMQARYEERKAELNGDYTKSARGRERRERERKEREERERKERERNRLAEVLEQARKNRTKSHKNIHCGDYVYARCVKKNMFADMVSPTMGDLLRQAIRNGVNDETVVMVEMVVRVPDWECFDSFSPDAYIPDGGVYGGWETIQRADPANNIKEKRVTKVILFWQGDYCVMGNPKGDPTIADYYMMPYYEVMFSDQLNRIKAQLDHEAAEKARIEAERKERIEAEQRPLIDEWEPKLIVISRGLTDAEQQTVAVSNLKAVLRGKFTGVTFTIKTNRHGETSVTWEDGPTVREVVVAADLFNDWLQLTEPTPWQERFGKVTINMGDFNRKMNTLTKARILQQLGGVTEAFSRGDIDDEVTVSDDDWTMLHLMVGVSTSDPDAILCRCHEQANGTRRVHIGTAVRYVFEHTSYVKATTKKKVRQAA
jgi:hypothetical protein